MTALLSRKTVFQGHQSGIYALCQGAHPEEIFSTGGDGWIAKWNLTESEDGVLVARVEGQLFSIIALPEQDCFVAGDMNGGLHWVYPSNPELNRDIAHHHKGVFQLTQVKDQLYSLGGTGTLTQWNIQTARPNFSVSITSKSLRCLDYSASRNEMAIGASDHNIYFLDADTFEVKYMIASAHENSVFSVRYSQDGHILYSGGRDAHLKVWDLENNYHLVSNQPAHWYTINDIVLDPSGKYLATASRDKTIRIWDAQNIQLLQTLDAMRMNGHVNSVNALFWNEHGLLSASDDRRMIWWKGDFE